VSHTHTHRTEDDTQESPSIERDPPGITARSVVLGIATAVVLPLYSNYTGLAVRSSYLVKSLFPMTTLLPFAGWLLLNSVLKAIFPRAALKGRELLVIFSMAWIVGGIPLEGWSAYWAGTMAAPTYYASPENRWQEVLFDGMPWWSLPDRSYGVVRYFYEGLPAGVSLPWEGWARPLFWWVSLSLAMVAAGLCLSILFQRQWEESERLTYPLAQFATALTSGFDEPGRLPRLFRNGIFWAGFAVTFGVILWNVGGYFFHALPRITLYDHYSTKEVILGRDIPPIYLRVLPTVVGLTYFCHLDILFSLWAFNLFAVFKLAVMNRTGFGIGLAGQQAGPAEIIDLESHGAMVLLAAWSVWAARGHLRRAWRTAFSRGSGSEVRGLYRAGFLGLLASTLFIGGFLHAMGMSLPLAVLQVIVLYIVCLTVIKFIAASGFPYLFAVGGKGGLVLKKLVGTAYFTPKDMIALGFANQSLFFGDNRFPAWPALPHHMKLLGGMTRRRSRVPWLAVAAFTAGALTSLLFIIYLAYARGAQNLGGGLFRGQSVPGVTYNWMVADIVGHRTVFDVSKAAVWGTGIVGGILLILLRNRFSWWPLHPLGLAFQYTWGPRIYSFSIFLTWITKLVLLRIGGIGLYRRAAPFFVGLALGYVFGVLLSSAVDAVWFPTAGHSVHVW
jgi:hypothetical protein